MCWTPSPAASLAAALVTAWLVLIAPARAQPAPPADASWSASLVTYGPGDIYWQRFGHNALWLREPARGLDHTFNFGFFDFRQERFFARFVQGRMLYFTAATPSEREFELYRSENRSIRVQPLNLTRDQYVRLRDALLRQVRPENRDYLYDYYRDNCSTRVRDMIDLALGGALAAATADEPAAQNFRDHTRRLSQPEPWLHLGLEAVLGRPVDAPVSRWDEMFLPGVVAAVVGAPGRVNPANGTPLVAAEEWLYRATATAPPERPGVRWPLYLAASLAVALLAALAARVAPAAWGDGLALAWYVLAGAAGLFLLYAWLGTDHVATRYNENVLLFGPWMALAAFRRMRPGALVATALGAAGALALGLAPGGQYTADVLAAALPLHAAAGWRLWAAARRAPRR